MFRPSERAVHDALGLEGGDPGRMFNAVSTDTRTLVPGALFVALKGDRFDGHDFLAQARDAGATAAIVARGTPPVPGLDLIAVDDTLAGYGWLGRARRRVINGPVVAITGTNGKTSTKEMVAAALRTRYRTHATRANLNNLVGVPQTILEAPEDTEALVLEAGANFPGEIPRCREIIEPDVAIVTNAAAGHLEGFGGLDGVVAEKLALTRDVGVALVGLVPPALVEGARSRGARRVLTVGLDAADVMPETVDLLADGQPRLRLGGRTVTLPLLGRHQAANAMFAWAVARVLGLDLDAVAGALEQVTLPGGRGEVLTRGGLTIINDCYNANPASFDAIIAIARQIRGDRRLVFVAGTMLELGAEEARWHRVVAERLLELDPDLLAVVGRFVPEMEALGRHPGDRLVTAPDAPSLGPRLAARLRGDELVILKASRGVALERIIPAITTHPA